MLVIIADATALSAFPWSSKGMKTSYRKRLYAANTVGTKGPLQDKQKRKLVDAKAGSKRIKSSKE